MYFERYLIYQYFILRYFLWGKESVAKGMRSIFKVLSRIKDGFIGDKY